MRCVVFLLLFAVTARANHGPCYKECDERLISDEEDFDVSCNETCKVAKCNDGCDRWRSAISTSCYEVCEEDKTVFKNKLSLYCIRGCNIAINLYMKAIESEIGTPVEPYLVAETRTNVSIALKWSKSPYENISYLVQWRYDNVHHDWEYYKPTKKLTDHYLNVEGLHPYTKYRFRVAFIILENYPPIFSEESISISTLAYGAPSNAPSITCLTAVSATRISLTWAPPTLANGPILSYGLYIQEIPLYSTMIKDITDTSDGLHYMFNNLKPSTRYIIALSARNFFGESPSDKRNITTLSKKEMSTKIPHNSPAYLVYGSNHTVNRKGLKILDEKNTVFKIENDSIAVKGVALHVRQNLFFVADSIGNVHRVSMTGLRERGNTIRHSEKGFPTVLSIDWLHEKLFMAEEHEISRCDLFGKNYEIVLTHMKYRASDLHVDPINGYLYVLMADQNEGGLYRVDLSLLDSGESLDFKRTQLIVKDYYLTAFLVDYKNFRIILPLNNTVISVALDGSDASNIRENSQTQRYSNITSIAGNQDRLFYSTGNQLFGEEYHISENKYYVNVFDNGHFLSLNLHHMEYQPLPRPLNPVESVEVLFGEKKAKVTFSRPRLLGGQGKGSFQTWMYELELKEENSKTIERINVPETIYDISNLQPNSSYSVRVRAFCEKGGGGKGPWSSEFKGSTLRSSEKANFPYMLYGAEGLLQSDLLGDNLVPLIDKMTLNNAKITDISWFDEIVFISTNKTFLYVYNSSVEPSLTRLSNITMATSIAIDWFAPKLYWSSAIQSQISRANLDGSQPEPLPIVTMAKEIAIDSVHAHLYWATAHSVERSHLNGMDHFVYMKNDFFSGRHVMGLTLDFDSEKLFYMVRSFEGSILYQACLYIAKNNNPPCNPEVVGSLSENGSHGPVGYYSHRVFWLHENQQAFVSDINGNNLARMRIEGLNGLTSMEIIDPSLHPYPKGLDMNTIKVVPAPIFEKDIKICGTHNRFNITWVPVENVNYGKVVYEFSLNDGSEVFSLITNETVFVYPSIKRLAPFTPLTIGIQSFTYFASSKITIALLRSPSSIPSKPLHPRIFVMHKSSWNSILERNSAILVIFRWLPPAKANGIIEKYVVDCWTMVNETKMKIFHDFVPGNVLQYQAKHLLPNLTYFLQVFACTEAGPGEASDTVKAEPNIERPVPKLLLAKSDSIKVADIDFHEEKLLLIKATHPAAIAYMSEEKKIFVLEEEGSLMVSSLDGTNTSLIKHLGTEGTSLSIDWIGRQLYWVEIDKKANQSSVWSIDLSYNSYPKKIFERSCKIENLEVEPFSGSLIYTRAYRNNYDLMISDTNGSNVRPFFMQYTEVPTSNKLKVKRNKSLISMPCNCSKTATVGPTITIDNSDKAHLKILFVDSLYGHIWSSDIQGCICNILINGTESYGLPPTSITVDSEKIYWSNLTVGKIYSMNKIKQHLDPEIPIVEEITEIRGIRTIRAIGHHLQPFPDVSCLLTESYSFRAELIGKSSSSLTLHLPDVQRPAVCKRISTPSVLYTVYYEASNSSCFISNDLKLCKVMSTYSKHVVLENLEPFTNYSIRVSVMNYYSRGLSTLGPEAVYQTVVGTPSPPIHLNAYSVTPQRIDIQWKPPLKPNGFPIFYQIRWTTRNSTRDLISTIKSECGKDSTSHLSATILTTEAGKDHYIKVRAYSSDCQKFSDSQEIMVTAFSLPNNLTLVNFTSSSICLSWLPPEDNSIVEHILEYSEVGYNNWFSTNSCNESTVPSSLLQIFLLQNLNPKTRYKFRLILTYGEIGEIFLFPEGFPFEYMTSGDVPSVPGKPHVEHIGSHIYKVGWGESKNNGEMDILYELEFRSNEGDGKKVNEWKFVKNTTITQYFISNFSGNAKYEFRVRAFNEYGKSNFSYSNKLFYLPEEARALIEKPTSDPYGVVIASSIATVVLISVFLAILYIVHLKKEKCKKNLLQETAASNQLAPDLELATLEDLPLHANLVQTNALYNLSDLPTDEELLALPQIHKEKIVVTKFLGSGAFGEVFEGIVNWGEGESHTTMKVAIKALKKGASDFEKVEFLKEAKLMSNLKHDHILELLGVCFDNTTKCLILELMEGGDLLSYLRSNRPTAWKSSDLSIADLIKICLDVAEGCRFLESMHFVHRDLAARNCLVTSHNRHERRVKIGDFGLARDIYKNDYYRKEGEGLMPVRWMAPESLVYGIFTSQSDVWAFGVILWEIMTLGMQPYPARSNLDVLHFVRHGGILEKPENCPEELHQIMEACWSFEAEARPSFHESLRSLKELHRLTPSSSIPIVYNLNYFNPENLVYGTYAGRYDEEESEVELLDANLDSRSTQSDPAIAASENVHDANLCAMRRSMSCMTLQSTNRQSAPSRRMPTRTNERQATNKYLELLGDNEDSDGYQRPLKAKKPRKPTPLKHRVTPRLPMASPSSSYEDMHPSMSLNPLAFFSQPSDASGSSDLPGACSLQHSPASCELDSILQPSQRKGSASNSVKSWMDDCDKWSFSTASTATCQLDNNLGSQENLTSAISCIAGIDINHPSTSSNC